MRQYVRGQNINLENVVHPLAQKNSINTVQVSTKDILIVITLLLLKETGRNITIDTGVLLRIEQAGFWMGTRYSTGQTPPRSGFKWHQ